MFVIINTKVVFLYYTLLLKLRSFILNLVTTKRLLHQKACANRHEG